MSARPEPLSAPPSWPFRIRFSGVGSEYFRIWIVNLLLLIVTLGLYYPWARVRRLRYFYANTWVEGERERHALDFHAQPKRMLPATLLIGAIFIIYSVGSQLSPLLGMILTVLLTGLTPLVVRAALRFRLANTSWRGLRFAFLGSLADAYRAYWPLVIPAVLLFAALTWLAMSGGLLPGEQAGDDAAFTSWPSALLLGLSVLTGYLILPWLWLRVARYHHRHFVYGSMRAGFTLGLGPVFMLQLKTLGVALLAGLAALLIAGLVSGGVATVFAPWAAGKNGSAGTVAGAAFVVAAAIGFLVVSRGLLLPYILVRQQNLVWTATRGPDIGFNSELRYWPTVRLTVFNGLLTVLTLGLYRPFAQVAMARLRLGAISGAFREDPAGTIAREREKRSALGDLGGEIFDLGAGL